MTFALKIAVAWIVFDLFVFLPLWIAALGGLRDDLGDDR